MRKTQMVGIAGLAAANEAGLFGHEPQMGLVPQPLGLGDCQHALVDAGADLVGSPLAGPVRLAERSSSGVDWSRLSRA